MKMHCATFRSARGSGLLSHTRAGRGRPQLRMCGLQYRRIFREDSPTLFFPLRLSNLSSSTRCAPTVPMNSPISLLKMLQLASHFWKLTCKSLLEVDLKGIISVKNEMGQKYAVTVLVACACTHHEHLVGSCQCKRYSKSVFNTFIRRH
jgi:hypothetical protein